MTAPPPTNLGPYEIVSLLGKGGMGEVWRARDPRLNREVAIKVSAREFTDLRVIIFYASRLEGFDYR